MEQIYEIAGLRVIVPEERLCSEDLHEGVQCRADLAQFLGRSKEMAIL